MISSLLLLRKDSPLKEAVPSQWESVIETGAKHTNDSIFP